jgi:hypothetical protein
MTSPPYVRVMSTRMSPDAGTVVDRCGFLWWKTNSDRTQVEDR